METRKEFLAYLVCFVTLRVKHLLGQQLSFVIRDSVTNSVHCYKVSDRDQVEIILSFYSYHISSYSFRYIFCGIWNLLPIQIIVTIFQLFYLIDWILVAKTIQGRKLFKNRKTSWRNMTYLNFWACTQYLNEISTTRILQESEFLSECLKNSGWRNQMALELFWNMFAILQGFC